MKPRNKLELIDLLLDTKMYLQRYRYLLKTSFDRDSGADQMAYNAAKHINKINDMVDYLAAAQDVTFCNPPTVPPK